MSEPIFREKSLQKVKSPDNLNEYIRVANPGVWTILAAIICLLVGFCIWSVFGSITTVVELDVRCTDGVVTGVLSDMDAQRVKVGMPVEIGSSTGTVAEVLVRDGGSSSCIIAPEEELPEGSYKATVTIESIHPASFLTN